MYPGFEETYASYCETFRLAPGVAEPLSKPEFLSMAAGRDGFLTKGERPKLDASIFGDE